MLNLTFSSTIRAMNPLGSPQGRRTNAPTHKTSNRQVIQGIQKEPTQAPIALKIRLRVPHMIEPHMVLPRGTVLLADLYPDNSVVIRGTQDVVLASSEWDVVFDDLEAHEHLSQWAQGE